MKPDNLVFDFINNALTYSRTLNSKEKVDYNDRKKDQISVFVRNIQFGVAYARKIGFYKKFGCLSLSIYFSLSLFSCFLC